MPVDNSNEKSKDDYGSMNQSSENTLHRSEGIYNGKR